MAIVDGKIKCSKCKKAKPLDAFRASVRLRGCGQCRPCMQELKKEARTRNPERVKEQERLLRKKVYLSRPGFFLEKNRAWRAKNPEKVKAHNLKKNYGLALENYRTMLREQNFGCAICGTKKNSNGKSLYVDHCHDTGKVRGLLCRKCNTGIGLLGDNFNKIEKTLKYLKGEKI